MINKNSILVPVPLHGCYNVKPNLSDQALPSCYQSPCIMCVQYRGVFSTVGDIMSTVGDILSTVGAVQYRGGYHDKCGGYLEYRGGCSVPWGIS